MQARAQMSEPSPDRPKSSLPGKDLIYVVDDEAMLLEMAYVILEPLGYQLETFRDPDSALSAYTTARPRPQLLITDYAMHTMTGLDLIAGCRRLEPKQKVLLVSGTVGPEICLKAPSKPDRFMAKPYHAKLLIETVRSMLS